VLHAGSCNLLRRYWLLHISLQHLPVYRALMKHCDNLCVCCCCCICTDVGCPIPQLCCCCCCPCCSPCAQAPLLLPTTCTRTGPCLAAMPQSTPGELQLYSMFWLSQQQWLIVATAAAGAALLQWQKCLLGITAKPSTQRWLCLRQSGSP
jgi:hypothetical protein